jgi:Protein of unknown function (DUF2958)
VTVLNKNATTGTMTSDTGLPAPSDASNWPRNRNAGMAELADAADLKVKRDLSFTADNTLSTYAEEAHRSDTSERDGGGQPTCITCCGEQGRTRHDANPSALPSASSRRKYLMMCGATVRLVVV